jgi:hypothetical protein
MRVTILADDNQVYVEGHALKVDLTGLEEDIHAVQWYGSVGEVEYKHDQIANTREPNERIDDFSPYQVFVDRWMVEAQKEEEPAAAQKSLEAPRKALAAPVEVIE